MDKSKERAHEILRIYLEEVPKLPFIESIVLVGSLSDDTYTGNAGSDIDLVHIVSNETDYVYEKNCIDELISKVEEKTEKDIPIARVVYQQNHLVHPYNYDFELSLENKALIERPIEIFRILDSGITVYGKDFIPSMEEPTRKDVEMSWKLNAQWNEIVKLNDSDWYEGYLKMRDKPTIRIMTQTVLTTALSDYYFYTNHNCSSKFRILECVEQELPDLPYINLLRLCHKYRFSQNEITKEDIDTMNEEYQTCFKTRKKTWCV